MMIKVIKSKPDSYGNVLPKMVGKDYDVLKQTSEGFYVREGKLEVLVLHEEAEIVS